MRFNMILTAVLFLSVISNGYSQKLNDHWKTDLDGSLSEFINCANASEHPFECSTFIAQSLVIVYKVDALYSVNLKRHLSMDEIAKSIEEGKQWKALGRAYDQKVLQEAQRDANDQKAVVAVYTTESGVAHIAVILPGDLSYSGSWGYQVPNSASFFLNNPEKSYVNKSLSYAFSKNMIKDIALYVKTY